MNSAHTLFEAHRIPGNVVIDQQPAELKIDALAGGLGRNQHLAFLAELSLGIDSTSRRVPVADRHAAVDLADLQPPLAQLAERPAVPTIAGQVVERLLVLGEHEQLHPRIVEDLLFCQHLLQPGQLGFNFPLLQGPCLVDELAETLDFLAKRLGIDGGDHTFEIRHDLLLLVFGQVVIIVWKMPLDVRLTELVRVVENPFPLVAHAFKAATDGVRT